MFQTMLTAADLRVIADKLDALKNADVDVREFRMGGLLIRVTRKDDQRDGPTYYVTRLTSGSEFGMRAVVEGRGVDK